MLIHQEKLNKERGFTLVEALVALVVLTVALGPALVLTNNITNTASVVRNNLIAANLAQEAVEIVRTLRDENWFLDRDFNFGLSDGVYRIEWNSDAIIALGSNPPLRDDAGLYNYSVGENTMFRRTVTLTNINPGQLRVVSEVTWEERGGRIRSISVESHLFDWR